MVGTPYEPISQFNHDLGRCLCCDFLSVDAWLSYNFEGTRPIGLVSENNLYGLVGSRGPRAY